jgi:hypothetical protein
MTADPNSELEAKLKSISEALHLLVDAILVSPGAELGLVSLARKIRKQFLTSKGV